MLHSLVRRYVPVLSICFSMVAATALVGCGGGGGGVPPAPPRVTDIVPETAYSLEAFTLRMAGQAFGDPTDDVTVRLTAATGTPFLQGTSTTLEVPGVVLGSGNVECQIPITGVAETTNAFVSVINESMVESISADPILEIVRQGVDTFGPALVDGSKPVPFTLSGSGFHPAVGTTATVYLEALGGTPFQAGAQSEGRIGFPGLIVSDTEITGMTSYAGVDTATPVRVRVRLANGTEFSSPATLSSVQRGSTGVQGDWTYERVATSTTGLDYGTITEHPIRGCKVQLVRAAGNAVISTRTLDASGFYAIDYGVSEDVYVRVLAETAAPHTPIRLQDNTMGDAVWATTSPVFAITPTFQTKDFVAGAGWTGAGYGAPRASAPFALLDTVYETARKFKAVRAVTFPLCTLNWALDNRPEDGDKALGQIGGPHYSPATGDLWFLGKEDVETDEFDQPLIIHEWGHFFQDRLGRSDNLGGPHGPGDLLDPSVAFDEGIATSLAAMILTPDTVYKDTYGPLQGTTFSFDIDDNSSDVAPGWFSEVAVQCIAYDLFDSGADETFDTVGLGLGAMYDALVGPQVDTPYLTTIFSFVDALKAISDPTTDAAIDALCGEHMIAPVANAWGSTETNAGGWGPNLPVYHLRPSDSSEYVVTLDSFYGWNQLEANRRVIVIGTGSQMTIDVRTTEPPVPGEYWFHDVWIEAFKNGESLAYANEFYWGTESIVLPNTELGAAYIIRIGSYYSEDAVFDATVRVSSP